MSRAASTCALFVEWKGKMIRLGKATTLDIQMNIDEETLDFIDMENPVTSIKGYNPTVSLDIHTFKGSPDYEFVEEFFENMPTGTAANVGIYKVRINMPVDAEGKKFYAEKYDTSTIRLNNQDFVAGTNNINVTLGGNRTKGSATITDGEMSFEDGLAENWRETLAAAALQAKGKSVPVPTTSTSTVKD